MCIKAQGENTRGSSDQMSGGAALKEKSRNKRSCINLQGCDSWKDILTITALLEIAFLADNTKERRPDNVSSFLLQNYHAENHRENA